VIRQVTLAIVSVLVASGVAAAQQKVMLDVTADVGVSSVRGYMLESNSTGPSAPIRQNQNWSGFETKALLMAFKTEPIKGWKILEAYLHLYVAKEDLYGVGLCEVLAPWAEQDRAGRRRQRADSAACWQFARSPKEGEKPEAGNWWAWPGSSLPSVTWAHPMARYSYAGPGDIVKEKVGYPGEPGDLKPFVHLRIPVRVELVAGMAAGTNYGVILTDDKGQVAESYSLIGPGYPYSYNEAADPWVFTRDIQDESLRPRLEVVGGPAQNEGTPEEPKGLTVVKVEPSTSTVTLEMTAPAGKVLGYEVVYAAGEKIEDWSKAAVLPRWEIPLPAKAGAKQQMPIWTLKPGEYAVGVRSVSLVGNRSQFVQVNVRVPEVPEAKLASAAIAEEPKSGEGLQGPQVYAVPDNVKVDPVSGAVLRAGDAYRMTDGYSLQNPVWKAADKRVSLEAAANETEAFQVIIRKGEAPLKNVRVAMGDLAGPDGKIAAKPNAQAFRVWYVRSKEERKRQLGPNEVEDVTIRPVAWHGDAGVPLAEPFAETVSLPAEGNDVEGQTNQAVWVDIYVPKGTKAGAYAGKVTVSGEGLAQPAELAVALNVLPLCLPDRSSWIIELNSYGGLPDLAGVGSRDPVKARQASWEFYRLAKAHRQMVSVIPYKQSGRVDLPAPKVEVDGTNAKITDWVAFDEYYAPLLSGAAFAADKGYVGPGAGTPISEMYLPFHENWPLPLEKWYQDYAKMKTRLDFAEWAKKSRLLEQAFNEDYKRMYADVARQMAEHFQEKGWTQTSYQVFFNDKYYFKVPYFSSQLTSSLGTGTSFWLLDEPVDFDDYMANAFFLDLPRRGVTAAKAPDVKFAYRVDVSQPEMTRGLWDNICDLWVCGGGAIKSGYVTTAVVRQKWLSGEEFWHYGGGPSLSAAPVNMAHSFLTSWASGSTGMLPWWTTEGGNRWVGPKDPDLALFYTGKNVANSGKDYPGPLAGLRMKVARRAQQDIEYLHLLAGQKGWDRDRVRQAIAAYADDPAAPVLEFSKMTAEGQFEMRAAVVATILDSAKE
jgi:hypothetical protein